MFVLLFVHFYMLEQCRPISVAFLLICCLLLVLPDGVGDLLLWLFLLCCKLLLLEGTVFWEGGLSLVWLVFLEFSQMYLMSQMLLVQQESKKIQDITHSITLS